MEEELSKKMKIENLIIVYVYYSILTYPMKIYMKFNYSNQAENDETHKIKTCTLWELILVYFSHFVIESLLDLLFIAYSLI